MYFSANDGSQTNNRQFSSCSIDEMRPIIFTKGQAISGNNYSHVYDILKT